MTFGIIVREEISDVVLRRPLIWDPALFTAAVRLSFGHCDFSLENLRMRNATIGFEENYVFEEPMESHRPLEVFEIARYSQNTDTRSVYVRAVRGDFVVSTLDSQKVLLIQGETFEITKPFEVRVRSIKPLPDLEQHSSTTRARKRRGLNAEVEVDDERAGKVEYVYDIRFSVSDTFFSERDDDVKYNFCDNYYMIEDGRPMTPSVPAGDGRIPDN